MSAVAESKERVWVRVRWPNEPAGVTVEMSERRELVRVKIARASFSDLEQLEGVLREACNEALGRAERQRAIRKLALRLGLPAESLAHHPTLILES